MRIEWSASLSASCLHAAACFQEGLPVVDDALASALNGPIEQLIAALAACGAPPEEVLSQLVALAAEVEGNRQLSKLALTRVWGKGATIEPSIDQLAASVSSLEAALLHERPELTDELDVRSRPLRQQWESRGPGLLRQMTRLTEEGIMVEQASVVLVAPVVGGHGRAHLMGNRVTFEAMLVHPHPELPETLRLGWLLAQLNQDLPKFSERVDLGRRSTVIALATLPLALAAAETVELARLDPATLRAALECWHLPLGLPDDIELRLQNWWDTYEGSATCWAAALAALDAMLAE